METRVRQTEGLDLFQWGGRDARAPRAALDFCGEKHGGNAESEAAFARLAESGELENQEARVLALVAQSGVVGITLKEAAVAMGKHPNDISGRFTSLHAKHEIKRKDLGGQVWRRGGCAVWVLNRS